MNEWDEWKRKHEQLPAPIKVLLKPISEPKPTRPINDRQRKMLDDLQHVTFLPGSFDKRFCRNVGAQDVITGKQAELLEKMYHRYRRQIPNHERLCEICCHD